MPRGAHPEMAPPSPRCPPADGIGHPKIRTASVCPRLYPQTRTSRCHRHPIPDLAIRQRRARLLHAHLVDSASAPTTPRGCARPVNHGWGWLLLSHREKYPNLRGPQRTPWFEPVPGPCPERHPARSKCAILLGPWSSTRIACPRLMRNETRPAGRLWGPPPGSLLQPVHASIWMFPAYNATALRFREVARHTAQNDRQAPVEPASLSSEWRQPPRVSAARFLV